MIRRLFTILYVLGSLFVGFGIILIYLSSPLWVLIWFFTGWWIYPPANALASNVMNWLMVRSSMKRFLAGRYWDKKDYQTFRKPLRTQSFD